MVGSEYPSIAPKDLPLALRRAASHSGVMPLEEWQSLRSMVGTALPADVTWGPGTEFGTLIGDASGTAPDIAWLGRWTCLLREGAYEQLLNEGFNLRGRIPKLKWKGGTAAKLVEVEARPSVMLHGWRTQEPCDICGRVGFSAPDPIVLDRKTYDPSIPLQRIINLQTYIVVSPAMKSAIERMGLWGATFPVLEWK
jgi:hypothetical protein